MQRENKNVFVARWLFQLWKVKCHNLSNTDLRSVVSKLLTYSFFFKKGTNTAGILSLVRKKTKVPFWPYGKL